MTPNRFTRASQTAYWNTGNGSPDAIELMVDKPGIVIAGICLYGGEGSYNYELELLDEVNINIYNKKSNICYCEIDFFGRHESFVCVFFLKKSYIPLVLEFFDFKIPCTYM